MGTRNKYSWWRWDERRPLYSRILNTFQNVLGYARTADSIIYFRNSFQGVLFYPGDFDLPSKIMGRNIKKAPIIL